jgi:hypothetical protein
LFQNFRQSFHRKNQPISSLQCLLKYHNTAIYGFFFIANLCCCGFRDFSFHFLMGLFRCCKSDFDIRNFNAVSPKVFTFD